MVIGYCFFLFIAATQEADNGYYHDDNEMLDQRATSQRQRMGGLREREEQQQELMELEKYVHIHVDVACGCGMLTTGGSCWPNVVVSM